jgi:hypothetical protein
MAANIRRILASHLFALTEQQRVLDKSREKVLRTQLDLSQPQPASSQEQLQTYIKSYELLVQSVEKCPLNNEWIYQLIGWYNMTSFYRTLLERLIEAEHE